MLSVEDLRLEFGGKILDEVKVTLAVMKGRDALDSTLRHCFSPVEL
jgi:hypothetical protein